MSAADFTPERIAQLREGGRWWGQEMWREMVDAIEELKKENEALKAENADLLDSNTRNWEQVLNRPRPPGRDLPPFDYLREKPK